MLKIDSEKHIIKKLYRTMIAKIFLLKWYLYDYQFYKQNIAFFFDDHTN